MRASRAVSEARESAAASVPKVPLMRGTRTSKSPREIRSATDASSRGTWEGTTGSRASPSPTPTMARASRATSMDCWKAAMGSSDGRAGAERTATGPSIPERASGRARNAGALRKSSGSPGSPAAAGTGPRRPTSTMPAPPRVAAATTAAASAGDREEAGVAPRKVRSAPVAAWSRPVQRGSMGSPKASVIPRSAWCTATA